MFGDSDERSPLLQFPGPYGSREVENLPDAYKQFCHLIGSRPGDHPPNKAYYPPRESLYHRAIEHRKNQGRMYVLTSTLTNTLLLSQIVLGAALTGLGASDSSRVLITVFGALNTIIAGLIAFLKSRGQPMRARMFRDDLDRVVDEIENSAVMWKGISQNVHGYGAIDTDDSVTVRSEVARLTRLYDKAVRTSTMNDPDHYGAAGGNENAGAGLRSRTGQTLLPAMPPAMPPAAAPSGSAAPEPTPVNPGPSADPDESPATKVPAPPKEEQPPKDSAAPAGDSNPSDDKGKAPEETKPADAAAPSAPSSAPVPAPAPTPALPLTPADPDASPATQVHVDKPKNDNKTAEGTTSNGQAGEGASKSS